MKSFSHDLIIIGGGAAGLTVSAGSAQLGLKVALIEKAALGGDCLYHGCVPSKTLLKSASVYYQAALFEQYGLPALTIPPIELKQVMKRVAKVIGTIAVHDSKERFEKLGVEVIFGTPQFKSPHEITVNGKILSAARIVIATGSSPATPPIEGIDKAGFITNKEIFSLTAMPKQLITIGGGPIGVELSQALLRLGCQVTILNNNEHILYKEDRDMALLVEEELKSEGAEIINGVRIIKIEKKGNKKSVYFKKKSGDALIQEARSGDQILNATGRKGDHEDLGVEKLGIESAHGFIKVDNTLRTNLKHIYAIGDCNGSYLFTHVAGAEGSLVVKRIALHLPGKMSYLHVPWCTYCDPELASVGYNEKRAKAAGISYNVVLSNLADIDRAQTENQIKGKIKILIDRREQVIGTQIVGANAGDLLLPSLFAVNKKYKLMDIMSPIYPYPTMGEIQRTAAAVYYGPKLFNPRVRKILKTLFKYRGKDE